MLTSLLGWSGAESAFSWGYLIILSFLLLQDDLLLQGFLP